MDGVFGKAKNFVAEKLTNIEKPEASLTDVDLKSVTRDGAIFHSKVSVTNPYDHDIPICDISYTLKSAERVLVSGKMPDPGSIAGKETTVLDVPLKVPYDIIVSLAKDVGSDWDIDYGLELGLVIDIPIIGNFTIPLSKRGQIKLPTLSDIF